MSARNHKWESALFNHWRNRGDRRAERDRDDSRTIGGPVDLSGRIANITLNPQPLASGGVVSRTPYQIAPNFIFSTEEAPKKEPLKLPEREDDTPILAWKWARLDWNASGFAFIGIGRGKNHRYTGTAVAKCVGQSFNANWGGQTYSIGWDYSPSENAHPAPHPDCSCGWYALNRQPTDDERQAGLVNGHLLLDVEFFGRVIIHDQGYRAEKQKVLAAHAPSKCAFCAEPPSQAVIANGYNHKEGSSVAFRCADHVGPYDVPVSFDALAKELGCPVG